jgi:hypothetical protein
VRPSKEPEPPEIHCEQSATPEPPPWPDDWMRQGPPWAVKVLGILEEERKLRAKEHGCLADHRKAGNIR